MRCCQRRCYYCHYFYETFTRAVDADITDAEPRDIDIIAISMPRRAPFSPRCQRLLFSLIICRYDADDTIRCRRCQRCRVYYANMPMPPCFTRYYLILRYAIDAAAALPLRCLCCCYCGCARAAADKQRYEATLHDYAAAAIS